MARHGRPVAALAAIVVIYYVPQLIFGTVQFDGVDVHYASQRYLSDELHAGRLPFWTPYIFSGFPFLADLQVGAWYPLNWPFFAFGITPRSLSLELLLHTLVACVGAYLLAYRLVGNRVAAVGAGMFYGLSGYFAAHAQHVGMSQAAAWLPWLVLLLSHAARSVSPRLLACAALLGAMLALPGSFQIALYTVCFAAVWALAQARSLATLRRLTVTLLTVAVGGALLSAVVILPAAELVGQSIRADFNPASVNIGYFRPDALLTLVWPDYFGLLSGTYHGPGDSTQHYFYAGILLVPLVVLGARNRPLLVQAALLGLPFLWYALGPAGGLYRLIVRLPGFASVELPMHGWFLPALGIALLGAAGLARLRPSLAVLAVALTCVDVLVFNQLRLPLAYARESFESLYGTPLAAFESRVAAAAPPVERLYGPPLSAVGYRNHALQSRVETTYGYNPLELRNYAAYADAAEANSRLIDGFAANYRLGPSGTLEPIPSAVPIASFARSLTPLSDETALRRALASLDPSRETLVVCDSALASVCDSPLSSVRGSGTTIVQGSETSTARGSAPPTARESTTTGIRDVGQTSVGDGAAIAFDPDSSASVVAHGDDWLTLRYASGTRTLLRVAIPAFPGWHASANGMELPVETVDGAFLGVVLPPGQGELMLQYQPRFFLLGAALSGLALLATAAVLVRQDRQK